MLSTSSHTSVTDTDNVSEASRELCVVVTSPSYTTSLCHGSLSLLLFSSMLENVPLMCVAWEMLVE